MLRASIFVFYGLLDFKNMRKYFLGFAILATLAVSCKKDKGFIKATVIDTGDITTDGCGYILRYEDGNTDKPDYLPSDYQHNNLKVLVKVHSSGILDTCSFSTPRKFYQLIYIDDIKKDL